MAGEIKSIKYQFMSFFIGFTLQAIYLSYMISTPKSTFFFECIKTMILLVTFVVPILVILHAHFRTFRGMSQDRSSEKQRNRM